MNHKEKITFHNLELDDFQIKAVECIKKNESVIVSAPTGAGKTLIAEFAINNALIEQKKIIYTAPIKALSNQKYREFQKSFPEMVGIITGDVSVNPNASILIMTTEIFKNRILEDGNSFKNYSWIIFDEIHYLDDTDRGTVWEESLIFLPKHFRFIGLSATIPNIEEFADWLRSIHKNKIRVIIKKKRPVPLNFYYICCNKITNDIEKLKKYGLSRIRKYLNKDNYNIRENLKNSKPITTKIISSLKDKKRIPIIYFTFSRKRTEVLAKKNSSINLFNDEQEAEAALDYFNKLCKRLDIANSDRLNELRKLIKKGIAYHHAGLLPMQKEVIEQLFTKKHIKLIFTTETFALGVNMPARSVIIDELKKRYDKFTRLIKARDFYQMAGRAGRRGIDKRGYVYSFVNPLKISFDEIKQLDSSNFEPIISKFNATYSTILNLYNEHGEKLIDIYKLSFHYFQNKRKKPSLSFEQLKIRLRVLKALEYIKNGKLTKKGMFAKLIHGYGLILSELNAEDLLIELDYKELAVLILSIVYEPKPGARMPQISDKYKKIRRYTTDTINRIHSYEKKYGLLIKSKKCYYDLTFSLNEWMKEKEFDEIVFSLKIDEGELIRYYRMAIQLMRELLRTPISDSTKENIETAIALINYGLIDAENQLRNTIQSMDKEVRENE